jgi:N-acetylmuramoyl-L-alanine amidase
MRALKVMLDPGHGRISNAVYDRGASRHYGEAVFYEDEMNLLTAHLISQKLRKEGFSVNLTRKGFWGKKLATRAMLANMWGADFFLSLHMNSYTTPQPRGFEVHHYPGSLKGRIIARGMIGKYLELVEAYQPFAVHGQTGLFASNFAVLRKTKMPAVLVEFGFLSNDEDLDLLTSPKDLGLIVNCVTEYLCSDQFRGSIDE